MSNKPLRWSRRVALAALVAGALSPLARAADETSSGDKLRILYSNRFTFTRDDLPLVTIEIMSGQRAIQLGSDAGVVVRPDGLGGPEIAAGARFTVTARDPRPATLRQWTIVDRVSADDHAAAERAVRRWRERGLEVQRFESGTLFAVDGEVIDTREELIAVDPVAAPRGPARARAIARRYKIETEVHDELVARPEGTIVARSGDVVIENASVIWFYPATPGGTIEIEDVVHGGGGSQLATDSEDRRYFGAVYVTLDRDGKLVAGNAVAADDLLAGLVPSEMYPSAPRAALEAQAIAARTELLQKIGTRHLGDPYLLCSSQHCQVYSGAGREHPRATQAVRATRGRVLMRDGGGLVDARYSAACGGHGEDNEAVWGGAADPALRGGLDAASDASSNNAFASGVTDENIKAFLAEDKAKAWCGRSRFSEGRYRWQRRLDAGELSQSLARSSPGLGQVVGLEPIARGVSGRIMRLRVRGSRKDAILEGELTIRRALGGLRSSLFDVRVIGPADRPSAFDLSGAGFGHGVGMCQLGAMGMASAGRSAAAILQHYYAGARVHQLY